MFALCSQKFDVLIVARSPYLVSHPRSKSFKHPQMTIVYRSLHVAAAIKASPMRIVAHTITKLALSCAGTVAGRGGEISVGAVAATALRLRLRTFEDAWGREQRTNRASASAGGIWRPAG
jgi:hypothetical protein